MDPHQSCKFYENQFKTATCIMRSYTFIYLFNRSFAECGRTEHGVIGRTMATESNAYRSLLGSQV